MIGIQNNQKNKNTTGYTLNDFKKQAKMWQ